MPNLSSKAHHQPQRTCVVCKSRKDLSSLLSFVLLPQGIVFDPGRKLQLRKSYLCPSQECLAGLDKWEKQQLKRRFAITGHQPLFSALVKDPGAKDI